MLFPLHDAAGNLASFTSRESGVSEGVIVLREWLQDSICDLNVRNPSAMLKTLLRDIELMSMESDSRSF